MESKNVSQDDTVHENDCPRTMFKGTSLSNGTTDPEFQEQIAEVNMTSVIIPENESESIADSESVYNGKIEMEVVQDSCESKRCNVSTEDLRNVSTYKENVQMVEISECGATDTSVNTVRVSTSSKDASGNVAASDKNTDLDDTPDGQNLHEDKLSEECKNSCDVDNNEGNAFENVKSTQNGNEANSHACSVATPEEKMSNSPESESGSRSPHQDTSNISTLGTQLNESKENKDSEDENSSQAIRIVDIKSSYDVQETFNNEGSEEDDDVTCLDVEEKTVTDKNPKSTANVSNDNTKNIGSGVTNTDVQNGFREDKDNTDYEMRGSSKNKMKLKFNFQKMKPKNNPAVEKGDKSPDSSNDDVEIIGESKIIRSNKPASSQKAPQNVPIVTRSTSLKPGVPVATNLLHTASKHISPVVTGVTSSPVLSQGFKPGVGVQRMPTAPSGFINTGSVPGQVSQNAPFVRTSVAPPKPKSSLDQIELIRWEIQNRINTRPKYFKPSPTSDLGPLAKFLFDIGSDLIKEAVYHDLVKIQSRKNNHDKLNEKEKEDLIKLKKIEKDLCATIGHLKLKLKKRCQICKFQTESSNVMFYHKQYPHEDNKCMRCAHCPFITKQTMTFKFHMETDHSMQGKLLDKKATYECDLCPYENNHEQKLTLHKQRCIKQFRPLFNLHPSCLSGAEINLCLENIFYKPIIPKNLKLLQEKYAQQQAALTEAKRQQAEMQALAAQKKAAAVSAVKKQPQPPAQKSMFRAIAPRFSAPATGRMQSPQQTVPYNVPATVKNVRATVPNMVNSKQRQQAPPTGAPQNAAAAGFEACEICGGYVKDRKALRIHFFYAHRIDLPVNLFECYQAPLYCATCYVRFWTAQGLHKHIDSHKQENQTRGVVGKCISCGHRVLNLLLHMRVVHNREMQHYINALMCMFCGGHYNSRNECERHITQVHGQVDPVSGSLKSSPNMQAQQQSQKMPVTQTKMGNNNFVKGSVCVLCNLNFGRNVDLTRHCMRMHHTCMKCGMVVIDKASLMKHVCLSSPIGTRDCSVCEETGFHPAYYVKHLRDKHLKKLTISVARLSTETIERWTKCPNIKEEPAEILVEISDSDDEVDNPSNKIRVLSVETILEKPDIKPTSTTVEINGNPPAEDSVNTDNNRKAVNVVNTDIDQTAEDSVNTDIDQTAEDSVNIDNDQTAEDPVNIDNDQTAEDPVYIDNDQTAEDAVNIDNDQTAEDPVYIDNDQTAEDAVNIDNDQTAEDAVNIDNDQTAVDTVNTDNDQTAVDTVNTDNHQQDNDVKEVTDLDSAMEISSADEESRPKNVLCGEKRKLESPSSENSPKRQKPS